MRRILTVLACCLLHPLIASTKTISAYNASLPFRPNNVTGLSDLYLWVGSYYNATTKIEFTPEIGHSINESACTNVQGQTFTAEIESFLAITERGPYNLGSNPVNALLTLWNSDANISSLSSPSSSFPWESSSLQWYIESSPWVYFANNRSTESDAYTDQYIKDIFNLTLWPGSKEPPYNLTGIIKDADLMITSFNMDLKACNTSIESDQDYMTLVDRDFPNIAGWNWTYPAVDIQFDSQTANFTLTGYAAGFPYLIDRSEPLNQLGPDKDEVQGKIKVSFHGVIDPYHSDTLVNTSTTPTWLRTVGFGNNSMNIGYNSGSMSLPHSVRWEAAAICSFISLAVMFS